jgi:chaperonin cofactor prefoldin
MYTGHTPETRIALIEKRQEDNEKVVDKLSQAITAIQDLAVSLNHVIKIHEIKLDQRVDAERELYDTMRSYHEKMDDRISTVERDAEESTQRLEKKFDSMKVELQAAIKESLAPVSTEVADMRKDLGRYRNWLWAIAGGAIVASFFIPGMAEVVGALF